VQVALPERRVLHVSLLLHGLPLAAILLGAATGAALVGSDTGTLAGALVGLVVAVAGFRPLAHRLERATLARLDITPGA
jgi:positive regulator of sigma E activity